MPSIFSSPNLSIRSDATQSSGRTSQSGSSDWGGEDWWNNILEMNQLVLETENLDTAQWSTLATSIGFPTNNTQQQLPEAAKLTKAIRKRKAHSKKQMLDIVRPFFTSIVTAHKSLDVQYSTDYLFDAVPSAEHLRHSVLRLPTPKPTMSLGYRKETFSLARLELQQGLVSDLQGTPADLGRISQPIPGHMWPFLTIEVSDTSLRAAQQLCAISAATCNNAVRILTSAVHSADGPYLSRDAWESLGCVERAFSLAICGRVAALSVHSLAGDIHTASTIKRFQLDDENEVNALTSRLRSIVIWGQHSRLTQLNAKLNALEQKVRAQSYAVRQHQMQSQLESPALKSPAPNVHEFVDDFEQLDLNRSSIDGQAGVEGRKRRRNLMKFALEAGLPSYMKETY